MNGPMPLLDAIRIDVDHQVDAELPRHLVAELGHFPELPGRVDMQEREGRFGRIESLHRQMQHHRGILADRIEHDRIGESRRHLPEDVDGFSLEPLKMCQ